MFLVCFVCVSIACIIALLMVLGTLASRTGRKEWVSRVLAPLIGLLVNFAWAVFAMSQDEKLGGFPYRHSDAFWNFVGIFQLVLPVSAIVFVLAIMKVIRNRKKLQTVEES